MRTWVCRDSCRDQLIEVTEKGDTILVLRSRVIDRKLKFLAKMVRLEDVDDHQSSEMEQ